MEATTNLESLKRAAELTPAAIEAAGGGAEIAKAFGIRPQAVYQWRLIPPNRVATVARMTRGRFSPHQLRPDIYPDEN